MRNRQSISVERSNSVVICIFKDKDMYIELDKVPNCIKKHVRYMYTYNYYLIFFIIKNSVEVGTTPLSPEFPRNAPGHAHRLV